MKRKILVQQLISTVLVGSIIALPLISGLFLLRVFNQQPTEVTSSVAVPLLDQDDYEILWEKATERQLLGSSPAAILNYETLPFGRPDPFIP